MNRTQTRKLLAIALLAVAATAAAAGGVLRVAVPYNVNTLDPHGSNALDLGTVSVARNVFDSLVVRGATGFEPALAASWSNPDPTTWVFTLREGVTFHDGTPFTAEDVRATIAHVVEQAGPAAPLFAPVTVTTRGDLEVVMTTEAPLGTMLVNLTRLWIGPAERIGDEAFRMLPVGTGPFVVTEYVVDDRISLRANEDYWGGRPSLDGIEMLRIPELSSRLTALTTGEIDLTWLIPSDQLPELEANREIVVTSVPSYGSYVLWFNSGREPFTDARVRRAVWHAIDYATIIDALYQGVGVAAQGPVTPAVFGFVPQEPYAYDPDLARQLLTDAGYPDGFVTSIMWANPAYSDLSYAIVSDLARVGITVDPLLKEHAIWLQDLLALEFDMNNMVQSAANGDADILLGRLYLCANKRTGYCSEELDALLLAARAETDQEARLELYAQASAIIWGEALGMFPIDVLATYALRTHVTGFQPDPAQTPSFYSVELGR